MTEAKATRPVRIARHRERLDALNDALPIQRERIAESERRLTELQAAFAAEVLLHVNAAKVDAIAGVRDLFAALPERLIQLATLDEIRRQLVGKRAPVASAVHPDALANGAGWATRILAALPANVRPAITADELTAGAEALAAETISKFSKGD